MKLSKTLKLFFTSMMTQKNVIKLEDIELILDGALEVGTAVYVESTDDESNLEYVPAPDGEYPYEDKIIKVEAGVIADIKDAEKPEEKPEEKPASGEPATVAAEEEPTEPASGEPVAESEPSELEAVKADMAELKSKFEELQNNFNTLRDEVNSLLTSPNEESAFSASKPSTDKADANKPISIFKCN